MASLNSNISLVSPSVVCLNEHGLTGRNKLVIDKYHSFTRNRKDKRMGGVATAVKEEDSKDVIKIAEGADDDEFIITRHSQFLVPINIMNIYGETESRCTENEIKERWNRILTHIIKIKQRKEHLILLGDWNKHVGNDEWGIKGNHEKVSVGGKSVSYTHLTLPTNREV